MKVSSFSVTTETVTSVQTLQKGRNIIQPNNTVLPFQHYWEPRINSLTIAHKIQSVYRSPTRYHYTKTRKTKASLPLYNAMANVAITPSRIIQSSPKTPKLHIQTLSEDIADDQIVCSCSQGRPPAGQNVVHCRECRKWHHMPCQVGENALPGAAALKGYQCRGCKTLRRSNSGKIAREKRRVAADDASSSAKSAKRESSASTPTLAKVRKKSKLNSSQSVSSTCPKQIARSSSPEIDDEVPCGKAGQDETSGALMQYSGVHEPGSCCKKTIREGFIEVTKHFNEMPDLELCECVSDPLGQNTYVVRCLDCETLHTEDCMISLDEDPIGKGFLCKNCSHKRAVQDAAWKKYKMLKAAYDFKVIKLNVAYGKKIFAHNMLYVIKNHLWKAYCTLPWSNPSIATPAAKELTSLYFSKESGSMIPIHPAPCGWIEQVFHKMMALIASVEKQTLMELGGPSESILSPFNPDRLLMTLREVAVIAIHHKEGKRTTKWEMGVLTELLGLAEKGTYWKG